MKKKPLIILTGPTRSEERRVGKDAICDWSSDVCSSDLDDYFHD